jgi:hypothetical protein
MDTLICCSTIPCQISTYYGVNGSKEVPPGQYKVWFSLVQTVNQVADPRTKEIMRVNVTLLIAEEYTSIKNTPLSFDVKADGPKVYDIVVKKPAPPVKRKR